MVIRADLCFEVQELFFCELGKSAKSETLHFLKERIYHYQGR
jgi:hypothetical protein